MRTKVGALPKNSDEHNTWQGNMSQKKSQLARKVVDIQHRLDIEIAKLTDLIGSSDTTASDDPMLKQLQDHADFFKAAMWTFAASATLTSYKLMSGPVRGPIHNNNNNHTQASVALLLRHPLHSSY